MNRKKNGETLRQLVLAQMALLLVQMAGTRLSLHLGGRLNGLSQRITQSQLWEAGVRWLGPGT